MSTLEMVALIITYALIDSVDPCVYSMLALVLASSILISSQYAIRAGTTFISALYIGYVLFGALLRYIVLRLPIDILAGFLLVYGFAVLIHVLIRNRNPREELVCREDDVPCKVASFLRFGKLVNMGLPAIFILGLVSSFTLLPCSSGLYVAYIAITRTYGFYTWLALTLLYVAIFISPLIMILIAFTYVAKLRKVHETVLKHETAFKLVGSIIMIAMATYIIVGLRIAPY